MSDSHAPEAAAGDDPLDRFSGCHVGILKHLHAMAGLPEQARAAAQARKLAADTIRFFRDVIYQHHVEEERELFRAVLGSAEPGEELQRVEAIVERLTREHRDVEAQWERLEPNLRKMAKGGDVTLDGEAVLALVALYQAHASYEEREFLPLSEVILGRDGKHMAALGLSLHMRDKLPEALARYRGRI